MFLKSKLKLLIFSLSITLLLVLTSNETQAAFSCDSGTLSTTCVVSTVHNLASGDTAITGTGTIQINNGGSIVGYLGQATTITIANLTINSGGSINFDDKGLTGGAGGAVNTSGTNGNTSGSGGGGRGIRVSGLSNGAGGGGGYGGIGGQGQDASTGGMPGVEYGQVNIHQPTELGSGGGGGSGSGAYAGTAGGNGGGAVKLVISGTLTLNSGGLITANGNNGTNMVTLDSWAGTGGGGSGGSIWISAGTITKTSGSGTIRSNGGLNGTGNGYTFIGGGGSGGRIAITYTTDSSSNYVKTAYGSIGGWPQNYGAAGSIYVDDIDDANLPDLTFDNNGASSPTRTVGTSYGVTSFRNLTFKEGTADFINNGATFTIYGSSSTAFSFGGVLTNTGSITFPSAVTSISVAGAFTNSGTFTVAGASSLSVTGAFSNTGPFSATALTSFSLSSAFNNSSTFSINSINGSLPFPSTFTNSGTFSANGITSLSVTGAISNTGPFSATALTSFSPSSTFNNSNTFTIGAVSALTFPSTFTNSGTFTTTSSGTMTFSSAFTNTGTITANSLATLNINNGTPTNSGAFNATNLQNFNISNATVAMDTLYVNNSGTYTCSGTSRYVLPITYSMNISTSGTVNHTANPAGNTPTYCLSLSMANLTIDGTSKVDVTGKGFAGGNGTAEGNSNGYGPGFGYGGYRYDAIAGGGAGYGGVGGNGSHYTVNYGKGGVEYVSPDVYQPTGLGSGGGGSYHSAGANGGGVIKLNISGVLNNSGFILANGGNGLVIDSVNGSGGGSGGSLIIESGIITGSGSISSNGGAGGNGSSNDGGGGGGGRISLTFAKGSGYVITPTVAGGTGFASGASGSIYYNILGTYTSSVTDFSTAKDFTTLSYNKTTTANSISTPSLTIDARAGNAVDTNDSSWTSWSTNIASGASLNAFDNKRYVQYRLNLASNNGIQSPKPYDKPTANPSLQDLSVNYMAYLNKTLTSSVYNSNSDANLIGGISWNETLDTNTNIKFQIQTSADGSTNWSDWKGPNGTNTTYFDETDSPTYCTKTNSIVTCTVDAIPSDFTDRSADRYYQYKAFLQTTDGLATPTLNSVTVTYVVNANPEVEANQTTAVPDADQRVNISYNVRDTDSISGTITPSFEYSLNGGSGWTAITSGCLGANDLTAKTVNTTEETKNNYLAYTAIWNPSCEAGISTTTYEIDAQIRVRADDGQAANRYGYGTTENFILDTKAPVPDTKSIIISARKTTDNLALNATDDSAKQMRVGLNSDLSDGTWVDYATTATVTITDNPETAYAQFRDIYGNTSEIENITAPVTPQSLMIQDTSNTLLVEPEYRLFIAWQVLDNDEYGALFDKYVIYRSADNGTTYTEIHTISDINTNYWADSTVTGETTYYYRVTHQDDYGNESFGNESSYSDPVYGNANGIQDAGEGGGGTSSVPPVISNVAIPEDSIYSTQATITWDTDTLSDSTVKYSADAGVFTTGKVITTLRNNGTPYGPHSVTLTNLSPNTTYYFQVQSADQNDNEATKPQSGDDEYPDGYSFTTDPGPPIHSAWTTRVTNHSATIAWSTVGTPPETSVPSNSVVTYSKNFDLGEPTTIGGSDDMVTYHEVTIDDLDQGTLYYYQVQSSDGNYTSIGKNGDSYFSFTTDIDNVAPEITFVPSTDISVADTTARIAWTTSGESARSTLEYGTDTDYDLGTLTNANYNTNHIFDLEDLTPETTYYIRLTSTDINDNSTVVSGNTFTTLAIADESGPTISDVIVSDIKYNEATVSWETGDAGSSQVYYGTDTTYGKNIGNGDELSTIHSVVISGLNSVTTYYYKVVSSDTDNNKSEDDNSSSGYTFTTTSPTEDVDSDGEGDQLTDIMSQIQDMIDNYYFTEAEIQDALSGLYSISITSSGPSVDITDTTATFTWTTNRPAIGKIYYWQDTDNEDTATSQAENITAARTDHEIIIKNLNANTQYNYYAYSEGLLGTTTQSENKSFSTGDTASLSGISISNLTLNSADISWTTTGSIDSSQLEYGESIKYGKTDKGKTTSNLHTVNLTNLNENTTYHLRVTATDKDGQTLTSDDYSFTTTSLPVISNVTIKDIQIESATINWQTNVKTDSRVEFKKEGETKGTTNGELEAVTDHSFTLTNLFPGTRYTFKVSSKDTFNNESSSEELAFTTEEDLNAPTITNVKSDTTVFPGKEAQIQTIISWNTDKDSNSILAYREGVEKDPNLVDQLKNPDITKIDNWKLIKKQDLTKNHLFVLTDLKPASVYQFRTASYDKHNNVSVSENYSLLTPTKQQSVLDLIIQNFESTFGWVKKIGN